MLFFLDEKNKYHRILRRGLVVGAFAFISLMIREMVMPVAPELWTPILVAVLAALDKASRELKEK